MSTTTQFTPGMAVTVGGPLLRVLRVYEGDFLEGSYTELLVVEEDEHATPWWVQPRYVTSVGDDLANRSIEEWLAARSTTSLTLASRSHSSSFGTTSSPSFESSSSARPLDLHAIVERIRESMSKHPSDAAWYLLAHAERDILDLVDEVKRLRGT